MRGTKVNTNLPMFSRAFPFVLLLALAVLPSTAQDHLALITDLGGSVTIERANGSQAKAAWGSQLFAGDVLKTGSGGKASLLYQNGSLVTVAANAQVAVDAAASGSRSVDPTLLADVSELTLHRTGVGEVAALGGLRSGGSAQDLELVSPTNTLIRDARPQFVWVSNGTFDQFTVTVLSDGGPVWTGSTEGTSLQYPETAPALDAGKTYFWRVEGEEMLDSVQSELTRFGLLAAEEAISLAEAEARIDGGFPADGEDASRAFLLGSLYARSGLNAEAIRVFEGIAADQPESAMVHEILGKLYFEGGQKDRAVKALQRALALAQR